MYEARAPGAAPGSTRSSLEPSRAAQVVARPQPGWLRALREAIGISIREVARRIRKTPQTVAAFEKSEAPDRITLQTLRHYAEAMDSEFVHAVVPKTGSLKQLAEKRARHKAETHCRRHRVYRPLSACPSHLLCHQVMLRTTGAARFVRRGAIRLRRAAW